MKVMTTGGPQLVPASVAERISAIIDLELVEHPDSDAKDRRYREAFEAALCTPHEIDVQFSGGIIQRCWRVTRSDGDYSVVYLPRAGYFSLCVDSAFGPLDIGVHGPAMACFASV